MMKVILQEDVQGLGVVGDMVNVRDGYGRNYLIPQGKAVFASVRSVAELDHQKRLAAHRRSKALGQAEVDRNKIASISVTMQARVAPALLGEDGMPVQEKLQKLFGTITNRDIAKFLTEAGIKVDHRRVHLENAVRTVGKYQATVRLDGGIGVDLPFWVIPEGVADVEAEKKRVEAAQEAIRRERAEAEAAEAIAEAAALKEHNAAMAARAEAEKAAKALAESMAAEEEAASSKKGKKK
jgi:large subunit ribosomal protein L9